jgi:DhnA family fructose-bisphosphate aldolase class Ia
MVKNTSDELVKLVGVASALGDSSQCLWLKVPYCDDFGRVTAATTLPILLLGGPSQEDPRDTYRDFAAAMETSANVRGALVGRNVTFPGVEDPAAAAQAIHGIVHDDISADVAMDVAHEWRGREMDAFAKYFS